MNLFELFVKIGVDDQATEKLGELGGKLGNGLKTAAKIGTAAVGAAAAGITALTTAAVKNYAEYEQLVGGVETLFKDSADAVQKYASNAYKTAGLSANEYMSTVTSFSASLLQSLGGDTQKAADYADLAVTDMADNANKMGTSMEMLQTTYAGFAKQNFTMLDNLKLGYGGTKTEMERLLADAEKISGIRYDISSFADITQAIHVMQEEMGIAGATALEAGTTIEGSVNSMKSAWTNLITGLSDENADIEQLVDDLVTTIVGDGTESNLGVIGNILPAVETALNGAGKLIEKILPIIIDKIPEFIENYLPKILEAGVSIILELAIGLVKAIPSLVKTIPKIISGVVDVFKSKSGDFANIGKNIIDGIKQGISNAWNNLVKWFKGLFGDLLGIAKKILGIHSPSALFRDQIGKNIALGLAEGIDENKDKATKAASKMAKDVYDKSKEWIDRNTKYQKFTLEEQLEVWEAIQGQFVEGSKQWADAEEIIFDLRERIAQQKISEEEKAVSDHYKKEQKALEKRIKVEKLSLVNQLKEWERIQSQFAKESKQYADAEEKIFDLRISIRDDFASKIKDIFEEISDIEQDYKNTLESTTKDISGAFGLFEQVEKGEVLSGQQLIKNMQDQITATERFYGALEELSTRGIGDALVDEIREMGIGVADELYALLHLSDEQLTQFDDLFEKKMSLASEIAEKTLSGVRAAADEGIIGSLQEISSLQDEAALYGDDDYEIVEETVEFSQSGLGISSAGVVNGLSADGQTESNQTWKINLVLPDGTPLASYLLDPLVRFANANGTPILNPI